MVEPGAGHVGVGAGLTADKDGAAGGRTWPGRPLFPS